MIEWRPVADMPWYEVSSDGQVRTVGYGRKLIRGPKLLKGATASTGYRRIRLAKGSVTIVRSIHGLVAEAFIGPRPEGWQVAHNNNIRHDNRVENLRYDTPRNNTADKLKHGTHQAGEAHGMAKLTDQDVIAIRQKYASGGVRQQDLADEYNMSRAMISRITRRAAWTHLSEEESSAA